MISFSMNLAELVTIVVPAGRGTTALAALIDSLCRSASAGGHSSLPTLVVGVARAGEVDEPPFARWRDAGGSTRIVTAAAGHATAVRNAAVAAVATPWVAFLDDDVVADDDYIRHLEAVCRTAAAPVVQGVPFLCSNTHSALARLEAKNYEQGFATYHDRESNTVRVVDARNLVMATDVARSFPFDEELLFAGEGQELARRLDRSGIPIRYCDTLRVRHHNRDTFSSLAIQKFMHGRGRAQRVRREEGIWNHARRSVVRHFVSPVKDAVVGKVALSDMGYRLFSNTLFWCGVGYEVLRRPRPTAKEASETA